jgi:hypothetical protein
VSDRNKTVFREISEVALRINQEPDDTAEAPVHEFFMDTDGKIGEPGSNCAAVYAITWDRATNHNLVRSEKARRTSRSILQV